MDKLRTALLNAAEKAIERREWNVAGAIHVILGAREEGTLPDLAKILDRFASDQLRAISEANLN